MPTRRFHRLARNVLVIMLVPSIVCAQIPPEAQETLDLLQESPGLSISTAQPCCDPPSIWDFLGYHDVEQHIHTTLHTIAELPLFAGLLGSINTALQMMGLAPSDGGGLPGAGEDGVDGAGPGAGGPPDGAGGAAADIAQKIEADKKAADAKVQTLEYLGQQDCNTYPEIVPAILAELDDPVERVRYAALVALQRQCRELRCSTLTGTRLLYRAHDQELIGRCRQCASCACQEQVIKRLSDLLLDKTALGHPKENSPRVRSLAAALIERCLQTHPAAPEGISPDVQPDPAPVPIPDPAPDNATSTPLRLLNTPLLQGANFRRSGNWFRGLLGLRATEPGGPTLYRGQEPDADFDWSGIAPGSAGDPDWIAAGDASPETSPAIVTATDAAAEREFYYAVIERAELAIRDCFGGRDDHLREPFEAATADLFEARLALALRGDAEQLANLVTDSDALWKHTPNSFAAVTALDAMTRYYQALSDKPGAARGEALKCYARCLSFQIVELDAYPAEAPQALVETARQLLRLNMVPEGANCLRQVTLLCPGDPAASDAALLLAELERSPDINAPGQAGREQMQTARESGDGAAAPGRAADTDAPLSPDRLYALVAAAEELVRATYADRDGEMQDRFETGVATLCEARLQLALLGDREQFERLRHTAAALNEKSPHSAPAVAARDAVTRYYQVRAAQDAAGLSAADAGGDISPTHPARGEDAPVAAEHAPPAVVERETAPVAARPAQHSTAPHASSDDGGPRHNVDDGGDRWRTMLANAEREIQITFSERDGVARDRYESALAALCEARLQLALSGSDEHFRQLFQMTSTLCQKLPDSASAAIAVDALTRYYEWHSAIDSPERPQALPQYARCLRYQVATFRPISAQAPDRLLEAARELLRDGVSADADACLRAILENCPDDPAAASAARLLADINSSAPPAPTRVTHAAPALNEDVKQTDPDSGNVPNGNGAADLFEDTAPPALAPREWRARSGESAPASADRPEAMPDQSQPQPVAEAAGPDDLFPPLSSELMRAAAAGAGPVWEGAVDDDAQAPTAAPVPERRGEWTPAAPANTNDAPGTESNADSDETAPGLPRVSAGREPRNAGGLADTPPPRAPIVPVAAEVVHPPDHSGNDLRRLRAALADAEREVRAAFPDRNGQSRTRYEQATTALCEARLQLALRGDQEQFTRLYEDAESLCAQAPDSHAAVIAMEALGRYYASRAHESTPAGRDSLRNYAGCLRFQVENLHAGSDETLRELYNAALALRRAGLNPDAIACLRILVRRSDGTQSVPEAAALLAAWEASPEQLRDMGQASNIAATMPQAAVDVASQPPAAGATSAEFVVRQRAETGSAADTNSNGGESPVAESASTPSEADSETDAAVVTASRESAAADVSTDAGVVDLETFLAAGLPAVDVARIQLVQNPPPAPPADVYDAEGLEILNPSLDSFQPIEDPFLPTEMEYSLHERALEALEANEFAYGHLQEEDNVVEQYNNSVGIQASPYSLFHIYSATPVNLFRLRFSSVWGYDRPDRSEYFWNRIAGAGPLRPETGLNYQQIYVYNETKAGDIASAFTEYPIWILDPEQNSNTAGLGDIVVGAKAVLIKDENWTISTVNRVYTPVGTTRRGLGRRQLSLESGVALQWRFGRATMLHSDLRFHYPIGAGDSAGELLIGGIGFSRVIWSDPIAPPIGRSYALIMTSETVVTSFLDGLVTEPSTFPIQQDAEITSVIQNIGLRSIWTKRFSTGMSLGFPLSSEHLHDVSLLVEFQWTH